MTLKSFLKLVEIQTKVASVTPFLLGTVYSLFRFKSFNSLNFILMLISLLSLDMATTAINNYYDFKRAHKKEGFGYESHNAIVSYKLKESTVVATIILLLTSCAVFGIMLYLNTGIVVLLLGMISFGIGVLYSFGPVPISRTPLGELFSGFVMGFIITFLAIFIHVYDQNIVNIIYNNGMLSLNINIIEVLYIFLISIPPITGIANIMLANNICDIEDDIANRRYTLPIYIGKANALKVFKALYYSAYIAMLILLVLKVVPLIYAIALFTFVPVSKHIKIFYDHQSKKDTFVLSVKNFVIVNVAQVLVIGAAALIDYLI